MVSKKRHLGKFGDLGIETKFEKYSKGGLIAGGDKCSKNNEESSSLSKGCSVAG